LCVPTLVQASDNSLPFGEQNSIPRRYQDKSIRGDKILVVKENTVQKQTPFVKQYPRFLSFSLHTDISKVTLTAKT